MVYDELADLQRAAEAYPHVYEGSFENALGCSQPRFCFYVNPDGTERWYRGTGIVRLWKGSMGAAVLAHEMMHMALAIYRADMGRASLRNMKNEETLCHIASDLIRGANSKLWKLGVYS